MRALIPATANELALTARNSALKVQSVTGSMSATYEGLCIAEQAANRAISALRDLKPQLARAKKECRAAEIRERQDRAGAVMVVGVG